ncbi:MAG: hypothetical protein Q9187_003235 [Circinaria calcarea]
MKLSNALIVSILSFTSSSIADRNVYARNAYPAYLEDIFARAAEADLYERDAYPEADFYERDAYPEADYDRVFAREAYPGNTISTMKNLKCSVDKMSGGMTSAENKAKTVKLCKKECKCEGKGKLECGKYTVGSYFPIPPTSDSNPGSITSPIIVHIPGLLAIGEFEFGDSSGSITR